MNHNCKSTEIYGVVTVERSKTYHSFWETAETNTVSGNHVMCYFDDFLSHNTLLRLEQTV